MRALSAALTSLIDYAGLFPPASLDLQTTIGNHETYTRSAESWLLGRCVVPCARLPELAAALGASVVHGRAWTVAALVGPTDALEQVAATIERFHSSRGAAGVTVTTVEAALAMPSAVSAFAAAVPVTLERFVEVPLDTTRDTWLDAIAAAGCSTKVRTGGLTEDRFPSSDALAAVVGACAARDLPLKATAGLHHAVRNAYRLTYEPGSPSGVMHGFVNLLVAALIVRTRAGNDADARRALDTRDAERFTIDDSALAWEGHSFTAAACADTRAHLLRSVGSCSFEEPVADLRSLGWL
jgi:hypothetical protein